MMTQTEALRHVAEHLVGYLRASTADEVHATTSPRDEAKIELAMDEAVRRLMRMGRPRR